MMMEHIFRNKTQKQNLSPCCVRYVHLTLNSLCSIMLGSTRAYFYPTSFPAMKPFRFENARYIIRRTLSMTLLLCFLSINGCAPAPACQETSDAAYTSASPILDVAKHIEYPIIRLYTTTGVGHKSILNHANT